MAPISQSELQITEQLPSLEPKPVLRLHLNDLSHPATSTFLSLIDCSKILSNSINHVLRHLYALYKDHHVPPIRSVTLVLRSVEGVAYTTGLQIDDLHKEIHLNLGYIKDVSKEPLRCRDEMIGVVTHEMVHCYQWNCEGTAPGGLIEGIADFVRLKSGLAPPHWGGPKKDPGGRWDAGYQRTAYFLEWLEEHFGVGTIAKMNDTMRTRKYEEDQFWPGLFGEQHKIDVLWKMFKDSLEDDDNASCYTVGSEPVILELDEKGKAKADQEPAQEQIGDSKVL